MSNSNIERELADANRIANRDQNAQLVFISSDGLGQKEGVIVVGNRIESNVYSFPVLEVPRFTELRVKLALEEIIRKDSLDGTPLVRFSPCISLSDHSYLACIVAGTINIKSKRGKDLEVFNWDVVAWSKKIAGDLNAELAGGYGPQVKDKVALIYHTPDEE